MLIFEDDIECNPICSIKSCMMFAITMYTSFRSVMLLGFWGFFRSKSLQLVYECWSGASFGASADQVDEIARMRKSTTLESLVRFCDAIETLYTRDYLRKPMPRDL
ncbi:unnamed protein product, partial [Prunus brigantina]